MNKSVSTEFKKYPHSCVCCKEGVIEDAHDICLICGWEDDEIQNDDENFSGGANKDSLVEHRKAFQEYRKQNAGYIWCNTWER